MSSQDLAITERPRCIRLSPPLISTPSDAASPLQAGLLTVDSLVHNEHLEELYLVGNPCADWHGYRQYVVAKLPQLKKLVSS